MPGMTYVASGVDYDVMDRFKRLAQQSAAMTASNIRRLNGGEFEEFSASRGESVFLIEAAKSFFAHVEEGLGTKSLVADAMYLLTGKSYYDQIAQDAVAMIVNDMLTLGALPLSVAMHLAVGESSWFEDEVRYGDLINGWQHACDLSGCVWGGGETPTLRGIIVPGAALLSGSAMGLVKPKEHRIKGDIQGGDAIILVGSQGVNANGLTMARDIAGILPEGYLTQLPNGRTYGETLLDPTEIYRQLIEDCLNAEVRIHYAVNITGHGWRKLMRAEQPFAYVIDDLPEQLPIFDFIQEHGQVEDKEMYATFNMGAGFALYVPQDDVKKVWSILHSYNPPYRHTAVYAGHVEASDVKRVVINPKNLIYGEETLAVR